MPNAAVILHPLAAKEYRSAREWYDHRSPTAGQKFRAEMARVVDRMAKVPELGSPFRGPYRWMRLRRFPYLLYYEIVDSTTVVVYAVAHGRRRPGYWIRRTRD